jgi:tetratricopeptide (TPR) repeat protein
VVIEGTAPTSYYLQARGYLLTYDRLETSTARLLSRKALESDPRYALAYAGLGEAYLANALTGSSTWVDLARGACEGALANRRGVLQTSRVPWTGPRRHGRIREGGVAIRRRAGASPPTTCCISASFNAYERLGRAGDAEQAYRRAQLRPQYWGAVNMLAAYYYRAGRYDDALRMFQQVVALTPDSYRGYSSVGAVYLMKEIDTNAVAAFKSRSRSSRITPHPIWGRCILFDGEFRRSADLFRQALTLNRSNYQVWWNLGGALELAGTTPDAAAAYREALDRLNDRLAVDPRDASLLIAIADCDTAIGDSDPAKRSRWRAH